MPLYYYLALLIVLVSLVIFVRAAISVADAVPRKGAPYEPMDVD